ncbi:MAG: hypothetical protein AB4368_12320 [Xenococcaceae cyanobacterium]
MGNRAIAAERSFLPTFYSIFFFTRSGVAWHCAIAQELNIFSFMSMRNS